MKDLSVIILSYNTKDITRQCLDALVASLGHSPSISAEVIVVDNGSADGSPDMLKSYRSSVPSVSIVPVCLQENTGFSKGNNIGLKQANGRHILFLNSDVIVDTVDFREVLTYVDHDAHIGALTVTVNLPGKGIDPASHRGFPTVWRSFCYYAGLERLTKNNPRLGAWFGGYHLTNLNLSTIHQIDSPTGAFFLCRGDLVRRLNGFDEDFFMYGEDLDLAYRIKEQHFKIIYYPRYSVTHLKYQSGLGSKNRSTSRKTRDYFYDAMKLFYRKHYAPRGNAVVTALMYFFIDLKRSLS